eukprot:SAG31_NODE_1839_length_7124_cov_5.833310_4_plen_49_part_00
MISMGSAAVRVVTGRVATLVVYVCAFVVVSILEINHSARFEGWAPCLI